MYSSYIRGRVYPIPFTCALAAYWAPLHRLTHAHNGHHQEYVIQYGNQVGAASPKLRRCLQFANYLVESVADRVGCRCGSRRHVELDEDVGNVAGCGIRADL